MNKATCIVCGKIFNKVKNQKTCSLECREIRKKQYQKSYRKKLQQANNKYKIRYCIICGKEFKAIGKQTICSDECKIIRDKERTKKYNRQYYLKNKERMKS